MLFIFTAVVMLGVAWFQIRTGILGAILLVIEIVLAGLVAFGFWEPLAKLLEPSLRSGMFAGCEDTIVLALLFSVALGTLRYVSTRMHDHWLEFDPNVQMVGGAFIGLLAGYLVSGFLICAAQTLPIEDNFLGFEPRKADSKNENESPLRRIVPPDRVWLSLMRHAGAYPLRWEEDNDKAETDVDRFVTFDRHGTFELRHLRYRRKGENRPLLPYLGELDREIHRKR